MLLAKMGDLAEPNPSLVYFNVGAFARLRFRSIFIHGYQLP
jgi:hypothetical protein